jgi:SecD/SecF fusion protein
LDSNLTTLIAAVIMFWMGSGPVRGYAVTLSAGILVSMYTAVWVTKMLFHVLAHRFHLSHLRMSEWVRTPHVDFLRWKKAAFALSGGLLALSIAVFVYRGPANFGVDFRGGASITFAYDFKSATDRVPVADLRAALAAAGIRHADIQYQERRPVEGQPTAPQVLVVNVDYESGPAAIEALTACLADRSPRVAQQENVGPQVGRELKRQGAYALFWAIVAMVIYIAWRFEFGYALGAIVAVLHDAVVAVGIFCLLGRQINMPTIAVVLTILGYSVNDTIVIFDRLREYRKLYRDRPLADLANLSINATLSRTLLTTLTTLLSVLALLLFGGGAIRDFALLLFIGMIVGTYSTMFIATPIALMWRHEPKVAAPAKAVARGKRHA